MGITLFDESFSPFLQNLDYKQSAFHKRLSFNSYFPPLLSYILSLRNISCSVLFDLILSCHVSLRFLCRFTCDRGFIIRGSVSPGNRKNIENKQI